MKMNMQRKIIGTAVGAVVLAFNTSAQAATGQTFALNLGGDAPKSAASSTATDGDVVKVVARGVGTDRNAALKDAYRDAVERAVGLYVDAETMAKNDEIVKDQVLTQSNAYVTHYDELEAKQVDGLMQVRIVATVRKSALVKNVQEKIPGTTVNINSSGLQDAHAKLVSQEKQAGDAVALLKNVMDKLDPIKTLVVPGLRAESQQLLKGDEVQVDGRPAGADKVMLRYLFELKLDREKYFSEFVPPLKRVLDQIALNKKEARLTELVDRNGTREKQLNEYKGIAAEEMTSGGRRRNGRRHTAGSGELMVWRSGSWSGYPYWMDGLHVYSFARDGQNYVWKYPATCCSFAPRSAGRFSYVDIDVDFGEFKSNRAKPKMLIALVTQIKSDASGGKVTVYELDKSTLEVFNGWLNGQISAGERDWNKEKKTIYNILTLDENGEEIEAYPWEVQNKWMLNIRFAEMTNAGMVYICPFVGGFGESMITWKEFLLDKDALTKIKSIKVELAE